jgi:hypothetical protein
MFVLLQIYIEVMTGDASSLLEIFMCLTTGTYLPFGVYKLRESVFLKVILIYISYSRMPTVGEVALKSPGSPKN